MASSSGLEGNAQKASSLSNLVRLVPLQVGELPPHPDIPQVSTERPELLPFLTTLLDDATAFLSPEHFNETFRHHSTKQVPPSNTSVEVLTYSIPASKLKTDVKWSKNNVSRATPPVGSSEHWFARRSYHPNSSSKNDQKSGSATWEEFVFGLRDEHSKHEGDFTPTVYDVRKVLDWDGALRKLWDEGIIAKVRNYSNITMGLYEMCHAIPSPMNPRCFSVLVVTASTGRDSFIAVTLPVNIGNNISNALYSNSRNVTKGKDSQQQKEVVMGVYTAVETVKLNESKNEIEWLMATASDAKGNLPMWMQKLALPGTLVKDVTFFLNWIKTVDEMEITSPALGK